MWQQRQAGQKMISLHGITALIVDVMNGMISIDTVDNTQYHVGSRNGN